MEAYYKPLSKADTIHNGINLIRERSDGFDDWISRYTSDLREVANDIFKEEIIGLSKYILDSTNDDIAWVTFRPNYAKVNGVLKRKWNFFKGKYRSKNSISDMRLSGSRLPFDRRELYVLQQFTGAMHNRYEIRVGFLTPYDSHHSWDGKRSISILGLYKALLSLGFDPLFPIRKGDFISSVSEKMASLIVDRINDRNMNGNPAAIKSRLKSLADSIKNIVQDYIQGGVKPILATKTLSNRRWRSKRDSSLYEGAAGINEALYETGQLCDAVGVEIVSWREKDAIGNQYKKIHAIASDRATKKQEVAAKKAQKKEEELVKKLKKQKEKVQEYNKVIKKLSKDGSAKAVDELVDYISKKHDEEVRAESQRKSAIIQSGPYKGFTQRQVESAKGDYAFLYNLMLQNKARGATGPSYGLTKEQVEMFKVARAIRIIMGDSQ